MKLTEEKIDDILDNSTDFIYDDLWSEFSTEWVEDYLDDENIEYDNEDVDKILKRLKESQKDLQQEALLDEKETLYQELDQYIEDSDIHLDLTDIGKVLVKLANSYLEDE